LTVPNEHFNLPASAWQHRGAIMDVLTRRRFAVVCAAGFAAGAGGGVIAESSSAQTGESSRSMALTMKPGTLVVASAYPDPPFDLIESGTATGFDIELMRAIGAQLGVTLQPVRYSGADFNGIFDGLAKRSYDAVISGTTITPERSAIVLFSQPYLEFNQGVAVNRRLTPDVSSVAGLRGLTAGIQSGNTSDFVAKRLLAEGAIAGIKYYPYDGIGVALDDLEAGRIGLVIKLFPVISWLIRDRPQLTVAMQVPTHEKLGIAFAKDNGALCDAVNRALTTLHDNGEFARLQARWLPSPGHR
jgi:polar amino acid transport system substrate-binding protein